MQAIQSERSACEILVVDDHKGFRQAVIECLQLDPGCFCEAGSGSEAVEYYTTNSEPPGVVIMDVDMPGMNGIAAMREILHRSPETRVVILTQHDDKLIQRAALSWGARAFLAKTNLSALPGLLSDPGSG